MGKHGLVGQGRQQPAAFVATGDGKSGQGNTVSVDDDETFYIVSIGVAFVGLVLLSGYLVQ